MLGLSKSDSKTNVCPQLSHAEHRHASHVFWSCMQQLQLDGDVMSVIFYPDWQQQQHAWPKVVQQSLCHNSNFTQNIENLLRTPLSVTTHRVVGDPVAQHEQRQPASAGIYSRLVSLATADSRNIVSLGVLCVHLSQFSDDFARDLTAARAPFGRLMDLHEIKRVVQVVAVMQCRACGALAAALGLCPDTSHAQPGPDADASSSESLWGRVVLMRLQGSGSDAVHVVELLHPQLGSLILAVGD